jgi:hypothetical protein
LIRNRVLSVLLVTLLGTVHISGARAGDLVQFKAIMVHASNKPAPIDRRLEKIEFQLRRVFKFEHYKHAGEGSLAINLPGSGTIKLGGGYTLFVDASPGSKKRISTKVIWKKGGKVLLSTSANIRRGSFTVLGGASQGGGKLIVTLQAR